MLRSSLTINGAEMKKIIGVLCLIFLLYIAFSVYDSRPEGVKLVHRALYNVSKILKGRYQLYYIGMAEAGTEEHYTKIGIELQIFHLLSKDEGRKMLLDAIEVLLKELNSNPKILPYLKPSPFTVANIQLSIHVYHPDGKSTHSPEIGVFYSSKGLLEYGTNIEKPGYPYGYISLEKESYEEALKIVESQAKAA